MIHSVGAWSANQIDRFIQDGFVKLERAFPREIADEAQRATMGRNHRVADCDGAEDIPTDLLDTHAAPIGLTSAPSNPVFSPMVR